MINYSSLINIAHSIYIELKISYDLQSYYTLCLRAKFYVICCAVTQACEYRKIKYDYKTLYIINI